MHTKRVTLPFLVALVYTPTESTVVQLFSADAAGIAVLDSSTLTNTSAALPSGNIGVRGSDSTTGFFGAFSNARPDFSSETANGFMDFQPPSTFTSAPGLLASPGISGWGSELSNDFGDPAILQAPGPFEENILANPSNALNHRPQIGCESALAHTGADPIDTNTMATGCAGGVTVSAPGQIAFPLPFFPVPAPATYATMLAGLIVLGFKARRRKVLNRANRSTVNTTRRDL